MRRIENQWGVIIEYPQRELASETLTLKGMDPEIQDAKKYILDLVPIVSKMRIPSTPKAKSVLESQEFYHAVTVKLGKDHGIELYMFLPNIYSSPIIGYGGVGSEIPQTTSTFSLMLHHHPSCTTVEEAKTSIIDYLTKQEVKALLIAGSITY